MDKKRIIQVDEKVPPAQLVPLSIQHVFAMFGASVLVPILFGIHSGIVLFMNGIGTLLFIFLTKGKAPAYLGSSFAFLAPAGIVIAELGFEYAQGGFVVTGLLAACWPWWCGSSAPTGSTSSCRPRPWGRWWPSSAWSWPPTP